LPGFFRDVVAIFTGSFAFSRAYSMQSTRRGALFLGFGDILLQKLTVNSGKSLLKIYVFSEKIESFERHCVRIRRSEQIF
jgi:hypothetical protein